MKAVVSTIVTVACIACASAQTLTNAADVLLQSPITERTTSITEASSTTVGADRATVYLKLSVTANKMQDVVTKSEKLALRFITSLNKNGIRPKHSQFPNIRPYANKAKNISYSVENRIWIEVNQLSQLHIIAKHIDELESIHFERLTFNYSNADGLKQDMLNAACKKVNDKKQILETQFDVKLKPVDFSESFSTKTKRAYNSSSGSGIGSGSISAGTGSSGSSLGTLITTNDVTFGDDVSRGGRFGELTFAAQVTTRFVIAK